MIIPARIMTVHRHLTKEGQPIGSLRNFGEDVEVLNSRRMAWERGKIVGRTRQSPALYDVLTASGMRICGLPETSLASI